MENNTDDMKNPWLDKSYAKDVIITQQMLNAFIELSGDRSLIHTDASFAKSRGFKDRVVHGALQAALVSQVLGVHLPGDKGVLQELSLLFRRPCYVGEQLYINLTVNEVLLSGTMLRIKIKIKNGDGQLITSGNAQCGVNDL